MLIQPKKTVPSVGSSQLTSLRAPIPATYPAKGALTLPASYLRMVTYVSFQLLIQIPLQLPHPDTLTTQSQWWNDQYSRLSYFGRLSSHIHSIPPPLRL